jgi:uncharacterized membrane protein
MNFRRIRATTLVAVLMAAALAVAVQVSAPLAVRVPLGLAVALVMPGFLGYRAVRGRLPNTLADAAISLVVSIGVLAVFGIALNLLPAGLTSTSWSVALLALSIVLGAVGDHRRESPSAQSVAKPRRARSRWWWLPGRPGLVHIGQLLVCAGLLCAAGVVTVNSQRADLDRQHMTEMWLTSDGSRNVVHVRNEEGIPVEYRIVTSVVGNGQSTTTMRLSDGAEWTTSIEAPRSASVARPFPISVSLYRGNEESVYREVRINKAPA